MNPVVAIGLVVTLSVVHYSVMGYYGYDPGEESSAIMTWSLCLMYAWWVNDDAKKQKYHRPYELGAFVFFAWPIALPAYLVATRGWVGIAKFLIFIVVFYIPEIFGWLLYYVGPEG